MNASSSDRGIPFVVAAPSGTGKTTVCHRVVGADANVVFSVSHTTRQRRPDEVDGRDYHFVTPAEFRALVEADAFLEWAVYNENHYGTSFAAIEAPLAEGRDLLLEIEVQGARQVRARREDARLILLLPPSFAALEQRLRGRGTDSDAEIAKRLEVARGEIEAADLFDYAVVNDDVDRCVEQVLSILEAERRGESERARSAFHAGDAARRLRDEARPDGAR